MRRSVLVFLILGFAFILSSCQDDPTSLGDKVIDDSINYAVFNSSLDSTVQYSSSYVQDSLNLRSASRVLLGEFNGIKATSLMWFSLTLPDSVYYAVKDSTTKLVSSFIKLYPVYGIGDKNAPFDFSVHKITAQWSPDNFNLDSLAQLQYDQNDAALDKTISDSLITVDLDTTVAGDWVRTTVNSDAPTNYGVVYFPKNSQRVVGFRAVPYTVLTDAPFLYLIFQPEGKTKRDTVVCEVVADVHTLEGTIPSAPKDRMLLQNGLGGRGKLYMDLNEIPDLSNINKATLTLYVDSTQSLIGDPPPDSINVSLLADSTNNLFYRGIYPGNLRKVGNMYTGEITSLVQYIKLKGENYGFSLKTSEELSGLDKMLLYGSNATDFAKRPKLIVYYSKIK